MGFFQIFKIKSSKHYVFSLMSSGLFGLGLVFLGAWLSSMAFANKDADNLYYAQVQTDQKSSDPDTSAQTMSETETDETEQASQKQKSDSDSEGDDQAQMVKYMIDTEQSKLHWLGSKVIGGAHDGHIMIKTGYVMYFLGQPSSAMVEVDMMSMTNDDLKKESLKKKLVDHLKNADFFYVEKFPTSMLKVDSFTKIDDQGKYKLSGEMTIRGVTQKVSFEAMMKMPKQGSLEASGKFSVDRTLYNIKYNSKKFFPDLGDKIIKDDFELTFELQASQQQAK